MTRAHSLPSSCALFSGHSTHAFAFATKLQAVFGNYFEKNPFEKQFRQQQAYIEVCLLALLHIKKVMEFL